MALGPDKVVGLRLEQAFQGVLDRLPNQLAQIGYEPPPSFNVTMGSGMVDLQYS